MRTVALDFSARKIALCEVKDGNVVERTTVLSMNARHFQRLLGPKTEKARVAVEACLEAWYVAEKLEEWGHEVVLVDTTRVRQIGVGDHGRKTDRLDAEALARALERNAIPRAHMLSPARQELRHALNVRSNLVETRAHFVIAIRALIRAHAEPLKACDANVFKDRLAEAELDEATAIRIAALRDLLEPLDAAIKKAEARLAALASQEPALLRLCSVPGVGLVVATAFVSVVDNARRFKNAHQVQSYLGLVPSENSSGGTRRLGSITKHGNSYLRKMLVQSAWSIMRMKKSDPLRDWAHAVAERRGQRVGIVALARRLAGVLWALWRKDRVYEPARAAAATARGLEQQAQTIEVQAAAFRDAERRIRYHRPHAALTVPDVREPPITEQVDRRGRTIRRNKKGHITAVTGRNPQSA